MLPSKIDDKEVLFRIIGNFPNHWKSDIDRPSSAAFKDKNGLSVDRDGNRDEEIIIVALKKRLSNYYAAVSWSAAECRKAETFPIALPSKNNPFHAEIHDSETQVIINPQKAKRLAELARVVRKFN